MTKDKDKKINGDMKKKGGVHDGHRQRLRDRMDRDPEFKTFADHELLEFVLSLVIPRKDTNELAHELIDHFGSLASVFYVPPAQLIKFKGMTVKAAYLLPTLMPLARRVILMSRSEYRKGSMDVPQELLDHMQSFFIGRRTEVFMLFLFDTNYKLITHHTYQDSSPNHVTIPIEDVVKRALNEGASYAAIAHNHPVGDVSLSDDDMNLTIKINHALMLAGIKLIEHAIYYENKTFSFHNNGLMSKITDDLHKISKTVKLSSSIPERKIFLHNLKEYVISADANTEGGITTYSKLDATMEYLQKHSIDYFKMRLDETRKNNPGSDDELMWKEFYNLKRSLENVETEPWDDVTILKPRATDLNEPYDVELFEDERSEYIFPLPDLPQKYKGFSFDEDDEDDIDDDYPDDF